MSSTRINLAAILDANSKIAASKQCLDSVKCSVRQTKFCIDNKILNSSSVDDKINSVEQKLSAISERIENIGNSVVFCINQYRSADENVMNMANDLKGNILFNNSATSTNAWASFFETAEREENQK